MLIFHSDVKRSPGTFSNNIVHAPKTAVNDRWCAHTQIYTYAHWAYLYTKRYTILLCGIKLLIPLNKDRPTDVTCFIISLFTARHVSNVSASIFRSLRLIVDLFHGLYCSGSMCVGVTVWFGWGGVVSLCRLRH